MDVRENRGVSVLDDRKRLEREHVDLAQSYKAFLEAYDAYRASERQLRSVRQPEVGTQRVAARR